MAKINNKTVYIVNFSKLYGTFELCNSETRHIVKECDLFSGIYEKIKTLNRNDIEIVFSDSAIDELCLRGFTKGELEDGIC